MNFAINMQFAVGFLQQTASVSFKSTSISKFRRRLSTTELNKFSKFENSFPRISRRQWDQLNQLTELLLDWNVKVNLISRKDADLIIPNHILPCLSISHVRNFDSNERVIDVGTGGGLPGLPMAIINPNAHFTLLDSNGKKMKIVDEIASILGLQNVRVVCARAETIQEKYDFLLGRAVSAVPKFLGFSAHLLDEKSKAPFSLSNSGEEIKSGLLYLKGGDFSEEIIEAGVEVAIFSSALEYLVAIGK